MRRLLLSKAGLAAICLITLLMAFMLHRITARAREREKTAQGLRSGDTGRRAPKSDATAPGPPAEGKGQAAAEPSEREAGRPPSATREPAARASAASGTSTEVGQAAGFAMALQEDLSFMDQGRALGSQSRKDRDRQGRTQTRRRTVGGVGEGQSLTEPRERKTAGLLLRLAGKVRKGERSPTREKGAGEDEDPSPGGADEPESHPERSLPAQDGAGNGKAARGTSGARREDAEKSIENLNTNGLEGAEGERFCPYGRPIRCELVFTIDSTMEETPLVALVMEPVYNNGQLVIPAGAELHGMARPDRLRDRIYSSREWVLLFPREEGLPNGRELRVKGLALDRAEPAADGLSWGITDGSNGLQGSVIRTLESEELKRFAAGFISAAALGLQEREAAGRNGSRTTNTPGNAALQGVAATMEDMARRISTEIERHGVFLRVPGGKQFYFYPQQAIHPWRAAVPRPASREPDGG